MQKQLEAPPKEIVALPPKMKELGYKMGLPNEINPKLEAHEPTKKVIKVPVSRSGENFTQQTAIIFYPGKGDFICEAACSDIKDDKGNKLKDLTLVMIQMKNGERLEVLHLGDNALVKLYSPKGERISNEIWNYAKPKQEE